MKETNFSKKQEYWKDLLAEQRASGLTVADFCDRRGIASSSFYSGTARLKKKTAGPKSEFIRIEENKSSSQEPMRIVFPNGATLYLSQTSDAEWVMEILRLVS